MYSKHCILFSIFDDIQYGVTPLMRAIQFHMVEQATASIGRGADVTAKTTYGAMAMDLAAAEPAMKRQLQVTR